MIVKKQLNNEFSYKVQAYVSESSLHLKPSSTIYQVRQQTCLNWQQFSSFYISFSCELQRIKISVHEQQETHIILDDFNNLLHFHFTVMLTWQVVQKYPLTCTFIHSARLLRYQLLYISTHISILSKLIIELQYVHLI